MGIQHERGHLGFVVGSSDVRWVTPSPSVRRLESRRGSQLFFSFFLEYGPSVFLEYGPSTFSEKMVRQLTDHILGERKK